MHSRFLPGFAGIVLVLISLVVLAWGVWPAGRTSRQATLRIPGSASQEAYNIDLSWPTRLRLGDVGVIRLVVESSDQLAGSGGAPHIIVKSRLEAVGLNTNPAGESLEPLVPGRQAVFYWKVFPESSGYPGAVIWVSLLPELSAMDASASQVLQGSQLLTAQRIVWAGNLSGLDGRIVRLLGGIGIVFGLALCLDGFLTIRAYTVR
jgi:hypothetical protein